MRRTGFFGATDDEREVRQMQQRDYAAQLQEQVRLKNARAEEDKQRRLHEQRMERELMDAQTQNQQPPRRGQQPSQQSPQKPGPLPPQQPQQALSSPTRSPHHSQPQPSYAQEPEISHGSAILTASSPTKHQLQGAMWGVGLGVGVGGGDAYHASVGFGMVSTSPSIVSDFNPGPSVFDSLLQPEPSDVDNQLNTLQSQRLEFETMWKTRRAALQSMITKPEYVLPAPATLSSTIPLSALEKRQLDEEIDMSPCPEDVPLRMSSKSPSRVGLVGDSILIPLSRPAATSPVRPPLTTTTTPRAANRRLAAAAAAAAVATSREMPLELYSLSHDSELVQFDQ